jgi:hypothetical protein
VKGFESRGTSAKRSGSVVLQPVVVRYQGKVSRIYFRADAAFAMPLATSCVRWDARADQRLVADQPEGEAD